MSYHAAGHLVYKNRSVLLKHHRLLDGVHPYPPNSLSALHGVLTGGAEVIELDIGLTKDGAFVLLHDSSLEHETTGRGPLRQISEAQFKALRLRGTNEPPVTLADVVTALRGVNRALKVQVDVTEQEPLPREVAARLGHALATLRENSYLRVVVSSGADWNLRILRRLDPTLNVGFDLLYYLDAPVDEPRRLPTRTSAYGYLDDHPLGYGRLMSPKEYLEDRVGVLLEQVPGASEFYLRKEFVLRALADGFNPIRFVHEHKPGALVDVWTLNADDPDFGRVLWTVLEAGADQITTDTSARLGEFT